jgi:hypothetical protein
VTVPTALEAHPATLRRLGVGALSSGSMSLSPVAVALLLVRFLDAREADREGGLLPRRSGLCDRREELSSEDPCDPVEDLRFPDDRPDRDFARFLLIGTTGAGLKIGQLAPHIL